MRDSLVTSLLQVPGGPRLCLTVRLRFGHSGQPVQTNHPPSRLRLAGARFFFLLTLLTFLARFARADAPSGQFSFAFATSSIPLIDLSGSFDTSQSIIGAGGTTTPLVYSLNLTNDPSGRIHGTGAAIIQIGNDFVVGSYVATGSASGGGAQPTRVSLIVRLTGEGPIAGTETSFTIAIRYNLTLNVSDGELQGTARGFARFSHLGSGLIREDFAAMPLPGGINGSWSVTLNVVPLLQLAGTGTISLPNGRNLQGMISGTYSSGSGIAKIRLTGIGSDKGFSVTITTSSSDSGPQLETVRGRVLGQTLLE